MSVISANTRCHSSNAGGNADIGFEGTAAISDAGAGCGAGVEFEAATVGAALGTVGDTATDAAREFVEGCGAVAVAGRIAGEALRVGGRFGSMKSSSGGIPN